MATTIDKANKIAKQLAGSGTGQSLMDRVYSAKHTLAGSALGKHVCKATTEEIIAPKKKHTDYLIKCSSEPNVSIPQLADLVIERTMHPNWVVVFKALISLHGMMNFGNERFCQYMASNNCNINLDNFADKSGTLGYDMSVFVRRYGKYMNTKIGSYRSMAFDFCKIKRGKDDGVLRTMTLEKLLIALPILQSQLDDLLSFDASPTELKNPVINAAFILLFKDLIRLFACYNDGIINLLERYFKLEKKQCRQALDLYKVFLSRMDKVGDFLKVAEKFGIDKEDIPDLARAPASLLNALEHHLATLEGRTYEPPEEQPAANGRPEPATTEAPAAEPAVDLFAGAGAPAAPVAASNPPAVAAPPATEAAAATSKPVDDLLGLFDSLSTPSSATPYQAAPMGRVSPTPARPPPPASISPTPAPPAAAPEAKKGSAYDDLTDLFGGSSSDVPSQPNSNLLFGDSAGFGTGSLLQPTAASPSASPQMMRTSQSKERTQTLDLDDTLASLAGSIAGGKKTDSKWVGGATSPVAPKSSAPAMDTGSNLAWGNSTAPANNMPAPPVAASMGDGGLTPTKAPASPAHLGTQASQLSKSQQELADLLM